MSNLKSSDGFKNVIQTHIRKLALTDPALAEKVDQPSKNFDDCVSYILQQVQKSGLHGFTDDEVFGMALHYFDEQNIEVSGHIQCKIVSNHFHEVSEEDKIKAKQEALDQIIADEKSRMTKRVIPESKPNVEQTSLF